MSHGNTWGLEFTCVFGTSHVITCESHLKHMTIFCKGYDPMNDLIFAFFVETANVRALVEVPADRWRFSGNFKLSHVLLTSLVFEL